MWYTLDCLAAARTGFIHADHLGSTSLTTDITGTVVAETRYLPYGEERWITGTLVTDFTFTGQRAERGFGLLDYNARYYDPGLGRFISPDSIVPNPRNPQDLNRYSYVRSNPLRHTDPSGQVLCGGVNECSGGGYQAYSYYMSAQDTQTAVENAGKVVQAGAVGVLTLLGADFISDAADTVTYAASGQWGNAAISGLATVVPLVPGSVARAGKGILADAAGAALRNMPGKVIGGHNLPQVTGRWLRGSHGDAGRIPGQIADKLRGQSFNSFDEFREAFWKAVADDPNIAKHFDEGNLALMKQGQAPFAVPSQQTGAGWAQQKYNLHHRQSLEEGGDLYDLDNIIVVTPRYHDQFTYGH
jgi:RHS repeat-associated protein